MAVYTVPTTREYKIDKFYGLNESPDGDTGLKLGEAAAIKNFRITAENNLQTRPGLRLLSTISAGHPIRLLWHGYVDADEVLVAVCNGHAYSIDTDDLTATDLGTLTDAETSVLPYDTKLYFLNGHEYKVWDGTTFADVVGYRPLTLITCAPATGSGVAVDGINLLNGLRRIRYTGTASTTVYQLPEHPIASIDKVVVNGSVTTAYTVNLTTGAITFTTAPGATVPDNVEVWYTVSTTYRTTITNNTHFETFNGGTDNRVFVYGANHQVYYSGLVYDTGAATAEYFPALNVMNIDSANTPVTQLIRHGTTLFTQKTDGAFAIFYDGALTDAEGKVAPNFNYKPINREIGNEAVGQVRLINNYPISLFSGGVYEWSAVTIRDERNAKRISDRIQGTLDTFALADVKTFDDAYNSEYWIFQNCTALIWNYGNDTWYKYTDVPASAIVRIGPKLYIGTTDGTIQDFSRAYLNDNLTEIDCAWDSGSMAFGEEMYYKSIDTLYISLRPEVGSVVTVGLAAETSTYTRELEAVNSCFNFVHFNFVHFTFNTNHRPRSVRLKLKVRKFVYGKITLRVNDLLTSATITGINIPVSYIGKAR